MEASVQTPVISIDMLADYQKDAMCRTIIGSIRRLLEDERNRQDFEEWKKARYNKKAKEKSP